MVEPIKPSGPAITPLAYEPEPGPNAAALGEASKKQQRDVVAVKKASKNEALYAQIAQQNLLQPTTTSLEIKKTSEFGEVDEAAFSEILAEMRQILEKEVGLFGQALEKSILESLHKKLKTLENRLVKKMIEDIFSPPDEAATQEHHEK